MRALKRQALTANVRPDGSLSPFVKRHFNFLLGPGQTPDQERREAARILRQIGWEPRAITLLETS